jgi:hypothetical protein
VLKLIKVSLGAGVKPLTEDKHLYLDCASCVSVFLLSREEYAPTL